MNTLKGYRTYIGFALYGLVKTLYDIDMSDGSADWLSVVQWDTILNTIGVLAGLALRAGMKPEKP